MTSEQFDTFVDWIKAIIRNEDRASDLQDAIRESDLGREVKAFLVKDE